MTDPPQPGEKNWRRLLGERGEAAAATHLQALGYTLQARNFRCPLGEIDLVMEESGDLVFVEVKTRTNFRFGLPRDAVSWSKQRKLGRAALWYCHHQNLGDRGYRFDVVEVVILRGEIAAVEVIRNAFVPPE